MGEEIGSTAAVALTSAAVQEHNSSTSDMMISTSDLSSPADRLKATTTDAQTPTTQASSETPASVDTPHHHDFSPTSAAASNQNHVARRVSSLSSGSGSTSSSRLLSSSSSSSSSSVRLSLPSPARSRLDLQYAKRLPMCATVVPPTPPTNSTSATATTAAASTGSLVPPPGITRDVGDCSIFKPVPAVTPESRMEYTTTAFGGISSTTMHPFASTSSSSRRKYNFSLSRESSSTSSIGSYISSSSSSLLSRRRSSKGGSMTSDLGTSDRFIPSRATSHLNNVNLWDSMNSNASNNSDNKRNSSSNTPNSPGRDGGSQQGGVPDVGDSSSDSQGNTSDGDSSNTNTNGRSQDSVSPYNQNIHNILLRSELLGENISPYASTGLAGAGTPSGLSRLSGATQPLRDGKNRLRFQSPRQAYQENIYNEMTGPTSVVNSFSLTPIGSAASQRLMAAPQKRRRRIAKVPFKVLDAPALQDDFYLNLVDWSSQNVLAVGLGSCVYLWSACTSKVTKLCDLAQTEDIVTSVSWAQRGTHLAVGTNRGEVQLWDTIKCKKVRTMAGHSARVGTLAWTGPYLASGSRDRLVFLRDVRVQAAFTDRLSAHKQEVCGLKWSYDEPAFLASGGNDNQLHVVDSRNTTQPIHRFTDHTAAVKAIAWSPHQHGLLASGGGTADRCIRFWNTLSGSALNTVDTGSQVCNLAWSQNCNEIVSTHGYSLNQIVVWRYPSLSKVVTLTGHTYRVLYLAVSPDGSTIVTGAGDETLRFWQVFPGPRSDAKNNAGGLLFPNTLGSVIR